MREMIENYVCYMSAHSKDTMLLGRELEICKIENDRNKMKWHYIRVSSNELFSSV